MPNVTISGIYPPDPVKSVGTAVYAYGPALGKQLQLRFQIILDTAVFYAADMVVADVQEASYIIGYTPDAVVFETLAGYFHGEI